MVCTKENENENEQRTTVNEQQNRPSINKNDSELFLIVMSG